MQETNGIQANKLLYDFYRENLWLGRFPSIDDAIDSNFKLFRSMLKTFDQLTRSKFDQLINDTAAVGNQVDYDYLARLVDVFRDALPESSKPSYESSLDIDFEAKQMLNLYTLCLSLNSFALAKLYSIVQKSLSTAQEAGTLPPIYTMRTCFRQVATDVELIQRAIVQRRRETDSAGNILMSAPAKALLVTDKLAFLALAPFQHLLPGSSQVNPITYFSQYTHIRRVPYSNSALLVGISYDIMPLELNRTFATAAEVYAEHDPLPAFELMAIPHEVGHYIYRHARLNGTRLFTSMGEQFNENPYYHWCEEIFADIYSCIVAGPLTALGLQSLLASTDDRAICANDGEHPTVILRPFILSEILRVLNELFPDKYPFAGAARLLNENWAAVLHHQGHHVVAGNPSDGSCIIQPHDADEVNVAEVLEVVRPLLHELTHLLLTHANFNQSGTVPWGQGSYEDLRVYDEEMAKLTSREFASKKFPQHTLIMLEHNQDDELRQLLSKWGQKGPLTIGGHRNITVSTKTENELRTKYKQQNGLTIADVQGLANTYQLNPQEVLKTLNSQIAQQRG